VTVVDRPYRPQPALVAAMPTFARNSNAAEAPMAANAVLARTFTSRLNMSLRERKGGTYGVRSSMINAP
jgi:zinc protease